MKTVDKQWYTIKVPRLSTTYNGYKTSKYGSNFNFPYYHSLNEWLLGATNGNQGQTLIGIISSAWFNSPWHCSDLMLFPHHSTIHHGTTVIWYNFPTIVEFAKAPWWFGIISPPWYNSPWNHDTLVIWYNFPHHGTIHHCTVVIWYNFPTMVQFTKAPWHHWNQIKIKM